MDYAMTKNIKGSMLIDPRKHTI